MYVTMIQDFTKRIHCEKCHYFNEGTAIFMVDILFFKNSINFFLVVLLKLLGKILSNLSVPHTHKVLITNNIIQVTSTAVLFSVHLCIMDKHRRC